MHQKLTNQKVHALHIIGLGIIARKCPQDLSQFSIASRPNLKIIILRKRPIQVSINLNSRFNFRFEQSQTPIVIFAFVIFINYYARNVNIWVLFLLLTYFHYKDVCSKPSYCMFATKLVKLVFRTVALKLLVILFYLQIILYLTYFFFQLLDFFFFNLSLIILIGRYFNFILSRFQSDFEYVPTF